MPITPAVPAFAADDEHVVRADGRVGLDGLLRLGDEIRFLGLAPEVFLVELRRELTGFVAHRFVGREQEPRRDVGRAHPSSGVDARCEHECDLVAVDGLADEATAVEQRAQPDRMRSAAQGRQAESRDDPVLADERHDVGERADGGHLDEAGQPAVLSLPTAQCLDELQSHTHAREVLVRVGAVVTLGVDDRDAPPAARRRARGDR